MTGWLHHCCHKTGLALYHHDHPQSLSQRTSQQLQYGAGAGTLPESLTVEDSEQAISVVFIGLKQATAKSSKRHNGVKIGDGDDDGHTYTPFGYPWYEISWSTHAGVETAIKKKIKAMMPATCAESPTHEM